MKRGEQSETGGRCYLCGGEYSEYMCGECFDACICGAHATSFWDINQVKWLRLFKQIFYTIQAMSYGDFWWLTRGWRGK